RQCASDAYAAAEQRSTAAPPMVVSRNTIRSGREAVRARSTQLPRRPRLRDVAARPPTHIRRPIPTIRPARRPRRAPRRRPTFVAGVATAERLRSCPRTSPTVRSFGEQRIERSTLPVERPRRVTERSGQAPLRWTHHACAHELRD